MEDLFERLNAAGRLLRLTDQVQPTMFRCATVTQAELAQLLRIKDIVRLGHVQRIDVNTITLDKGKVATTGRTLHVDCTADGLERRPSLPVFDGSSITLQTVRSCQQGFSAALIAYVEAAYSDDAIKNELCVPVPHPDSDLDFLRTRMTNGRNELRWSEEPAPVEWIANVRLNFSGRLRPKLPNEPAARAQALEEFRARTRAAVEKFEELLSAPVPGLGKADLG